MKTSAAEREDVPSQHEWESYVETTIQQKTSSNRRAEDLPLVYSRTPPNAQFARTLVDNKEDADGQSANAHDNRESVSVAFPLPKKPNPSYEFQSLQQWEGTTIRATRGYLVARLRDLDNPHSPQKRAVISVDDISEYDRSLIAPGAVFYWTLGYRIESYGQKSLISVIRFRRLPSWTHRELKRAKDLAAKFDIFFKNNP